VGPGRDASGHGADVDVVEGGGGREGPVAFDVVNLESEVGGNPKAVESWL